MFTWIYWKNVICTNRDEYHRLNNFHLLMNYLSLWEERIFPFHMQEVGKLRKYLFHRREWTACNEILSNNKIFPLIRVNQSVLIELYAFRTSGLSSPFHFLVYLNGIEKKPFSRKHTAGDSLDLCIESWSDFITWETSIMSWLHYLRTSTFTDV